MRPRTLIITACFVIPVIAGLVIAYENETGFGGPDPFAVKIGAAMAGIPALAGIILLLVLAARAHQRWISQFTPGQQRLIRYGEGLLALGALDAGLHQINRRTAHNADLHGQVNQYMLRPLGEPMFPERSGGSPAGSALHAEIQRQYMSLPGDPTAATQGLLDRSSRIRESFTSQDGWR